MTDGETQEFKSLNFLKRIVKKVVGVGGLQDGPIGERECVWE